MRCGPESAPARAATPDTLSRIAKRRRQSKLLLRKGRSIAATAPPLAIMGKARLAQVTRRLRESAVPTKLGPCTTRTNVRAPRQTAALQCTLEEPADVPSNPGKSKGP